MTDEEYKQYRDFFTDYWNWFKKYKSPPEYTAKSANKFWHDCNIEGVGLAAKYGNSRFAEDIVIATWNELERVSRGKVMEK